MTTVRIPRTPEDEDQADGEVPPWERDVPEGWHAARIVRAEVGRFREGEITVRYRIEVDGQDALVDERRIDPGVDLDLRRLGRLARACGQEGKEVEVEALEGADLEVRIRHGGARDRAPGHWLNVVAYRPTGAAPGGPPADLPPDLPF